MGQEWKQQIDGSPILLQKIYKESQKTPNPASSISLDGYKVTFSNKVMKKAPQL